MNRRELLKRGFELGAAGLLLPMVEPIRRYWSLDRTMLPASKTISVFPNTVVIGDYSWEQHDISVQRGHIYSKYDMLLIDGEPLWVTDVARSENSAHTVLTVLRQANLLKDHG